MIIQVPEAEKTIWTLGPQVCDWMESNLVFGPGDLRGEPAVLDEERRYIICRLYEVYPKKHPQAGRRCFSRGVVSKRKGSAKTELAAWIAAAELDPTAPVRCVGFDRKGGPIGGPVKDPYIPMVAYTEEQSEDLAYGALLFILENSRVAGHFDLGLERVMRVAGDGKAQALAAAPDSRDGARTTFQHFDEPLALGTLVVTPEGWKALGDIVVGDFVIGRDGRPARVAGLSPIHEDRACYRITFADGTEVVTDATHRWSALDRRAPQRGLRQVTTEQMAAEVVTGGWAGRAPFRWAVPQAEPLELPARDLPIEPYTLGVWLGDGAAQGPVVSQSEADMPELVAALAAHGTQASSVGGHGSRAPRVYLRGVRGALRKAGLLGAKAIPAIYQRASLAQRLRLLRGLMDTDGHATRDGWCTFVTGRVEFAREVAELLRTLGHRPTIHARPDSRSRTGEMVKVGFQSRPDMIPFLLKRKAARCRRPRATRQAFRSVVAVQPVTSVPVRCIGVENEDHLFLVGEGMVPTHNTHRFTSDRLRKAHKTMLANLPKRRLADAWSLETTTAPAPGEGSIAEEAMDFARAVVAGKAAGGRFFFFHRQASDGHDMTTLKGVKGAVVEASAAGWERSNIEAIVDQWRDPNADRAYLERVWTNRLVRASHLAFDAEAWKKRARPELEIPAGALVTLGFDGARYHDATALVATDVKTGHQVKVGIWEKPFELERLGKEWEVPEAELEEAVAAAFARWSVYLFYADPPYWETTVAKWAGEHGEKVVVAWPTNRWAKMAFACRAYANAILGDELTHDGDADLARHVGNAHRKALHMKDANGQPLWVIQKERQDSPMKIDGAMAGILSWQARTDALTQGASKEDEPSVYETRGPITMGGGLDGA